MASTGNGEPTKKETCVSFEQGSGSDPDQVEVSIRQPIKHKRKKRVAHLFPKPFERSNGSLINPRFDSDILETCLTKYYSTQTRRMFKNTVIYVGTACLCWAAFFFIMHIADKTDTTHWPYFIGGAVLMLLFMIGFVLFTRSSHFLTYSSKAAVVLAVLLVLTIQLPFVFADPDISPVGTFCGVLEILILLYSFLPLNIYAALGLGGFLSISFEVFTAIRYTEMQAPEFVVSKVLLHVIIHMVGISIYIMSNTRARSNFSKISQSLIAKEDLKIEQDIKHSMIHSLMPKKVAEKVMASHPTEDSAESGAGADGKLIFRNFQMDKMNNVSILFADIVGFTKMSSNKTAERLVGLLNDLFGRFDELCTASGCEKVSTLGDCYYCVSGCPDECETHAKNCVEMGLSMCIAIQTFDADHNEEVNMRVGIHTGSVLCGIVGTRRFKFDVWSNDVNLANTMESSGEPGRVHISESTREFIVDEYQMTEGEEIPDTRGKKVLIEHYDPEQSSFTIKHREENRNIKTYFIDGRMPDKVGYEGLEDIARETLAEKEKKKTAQKEAKARRNKEKNKDGSVHAGNSIPNDIENGNSAAADLFSQRMPDIMSADDEEDDAIDKDAEDKDTSGVDSNLLKAAHASDHHEKEDILLKKLLASEEKQKADEKYKMDRISLNFVGKDKQAGKDKQMELTYRNGFKDSHLFQESMLSSPRYQSLLESSVALLTLILLIFGCHVMFHFDRTYALIVATFLGLTFETLVFLDSLTNVVCMEAKKEKFPGLFALTLNWYFRNTVGVVMAVIPAILVYVCLSCGLVVNDNWHDRYYCFALVVALLQFCNFTMIRSYPKSAVAALVGIVLIVLLFIRPCTFGWTDDDNSISTTNYTTISSLNTTMTPTIQHHPIPDHLFSGENPLRFEIILSTILLLLLIAVLNYEFETSYRMSFVASDKAQKDKDDMQLNKDQADWLLHNIIPKHLAEKFKEQKTYSENHQDVGVIFATIVNFNEFYEENFAGGREYLRVLNELVSDYEVMLDQWRFKDVEKIKTISSSFMAASGLNVESRAQNKHPYAHLFALMEFATELQNVIAQFNESIFNFSFVLNIGFNFGPVTAGVIGTTKLLYDIWGDTVNIASRMYSTGAPDRIQVPQATADLLGEMFEFSYRGEIAVKGKGQMLTYLLEGKKPDARWE